MTASNFVIETKALTKIYGQTRVVNQLDLAIPSGSICGFLGANGAGKTTTIKLILGLIKPSLGTGKIFGKSITQDSIKIRERVGFLMQSPNFYGHLTSRETLRFVAAFFNHGSKSRLEAHIEELINLVGLNGKADRSVGGLSGGERQRLGIAQAAINNPELIILDEPASALDPLGRRDVLQILESFRGRSTVFYSTHILDDVQRVSDWVVILKEGRLVAQGSIKQLLTGNFAQFDLKVLGDGLDVHQRLQQLPWIDNIVLQRETDIDRRIITRFKITVTNYHLAENELLHCVMNNYATVVLQFGQSFNNLEDVFIDLVENNQQPRFEQK
ncbi:MAG: hypothetical protein RLZZ574_2192 [Cyanobacteriota bacterium]